MKIPTQKIQICVGIFLQHYTFLQKRTFSILYENFSRFVRKATKTVVYHYKNYIECSLGTFIISGDRAVINYLLKSGIGSRKSAGFGFAQLIAEGDETN